VEPRERILEAASALLTEGGRDAVSTRAVSARAGVQAPTIYRLFGDKRGLLDEVGAAGYASYVADKLRRPTSDDPVADLRKGWDLHVAFALANPALYVLMTEPRPEGRPPEQVEGMAYLEAIFTRIAAAGRLALSEEVALQVFSAAGNGAALMLLSLPPERRDPAVSDHLREATVAALTTDAPAVPEPGPAAAAVTLRAGLPDVAVLSATEKALLAEWLDRIASADG
jgi:AcrR family transcriptional regulator